jgi:hypothetical protein
MAFIFVQPSSGQAGRCASLNLASPPPLGQSATDGPCTLPGATAVIVELIVVVCVCVDYDVTMLRLHYYSNVVWLRLEAIDEDDEVYSLDQIKEFEEVSRAWKEALAEHLLQGIAR